jgi:hypothetical protein
LIIQFWGCRKQSTTRVLVKCGVAYVLLKMLKLPVMKEEMFIQGFLQILALCLLLLVLGGAQLLLAKFAVQFPLLAAWVVW